MAVFPAKEGQVKIIYFNRDYLGTAFREDRWYRQLTEIYKGG